jgi:hypothetical protein
VQRRDARAYSILQRVLERQDVFAGRDLLQEISGLHVV